MMDLEDKSLSKGMQSLSSSVQSTPEKNGNSEEGSGSPEEFPNCEPKKEVVGTCLDKDRKCSASSKSKSKSKFKSKFIHVTKNAWKPSKRQDGNQIGKKASRKGENPARLVANTGHSEESGMDWKWTCKNSACKAVCSSEEPYCKRCSCCICHLFDDNKDPSLWLECTSEDSKSECCGLSCHVECAIQHQRVGVAKMDQVMLLDASYACASCGKVSSILSFWKKQLAIAKDARRVDVLWYRINLSFRLLDGTKKYEQLHEFVSEAKSKLETEVGQTELGSSKMGRGIVSRLAVGGEVQRLCGAAVDGAEELMWEQRRSGKEKWVPAACKFVFEEVGSGSVSIVIVSGREHIREYRMWYWRSGEEDIPKDPKCVFGSSQRRIVISNMQPCTQYSFKILSLSLNGELGHSEANCFTRSREISKRDRSHSQLDSLRQQSHRSMIAPVDDSAFRVRNIGNILRDRFSAVDRSQAHVASSRDLDLNVATVPDLNEELVPPFDDPPCNLPKESNGSQVWAEDVPTVDSQAAKRSAAEECDSTLLSGSAFRGQNGGGSLDENFEECVKIIRWLECGGHIKREFRMKLLTWFSLRSTEMERRVVNTFIETLMDDPGSLGGQLVDSFNDIISGKRKGSDICTKLWH